MTNDSNTMPTAFAATPTPIPGAAQAIVTAEVLNVRAAPSATATIVSRLNKGAMVQILARMGALCDNG